MEARGALRRCDANARTCGAQLEALVTLHAARWRTKGEPGVLQDRVTCDLHREVVERAAHAGSLRLFTLGVGGAAEGVYYGFAHDGVSSYYLSGFEAVDERASLGSLLVEEAVLRAIEEHHHAFDFLRGQEAYTYRWGAVDRAAFRLVAR